MQVGDEGKGRAWFTDGDVVVKPGEPFRGKAFTITLPPEATRLEVGSGRFDVIIDEGQPSERVEMMTIEASRARYGLRRMLKACRLDVPVEWVNLTLTVDPEKRD